MARTQQAAAEAVVATSDELRRQALQRSLQRGARVARWRLAGRWLQWLLGQALRWLSLPLIAALALWWWAAERTSATQAAATTLARPAAVASASASAASAPVPAAMPVQLRLDDEPSPARRNPQLPSSAARRASAAAAVKEVP